tara:strand:- start:856 stop:1167 length:312 start_codon:yes stop_codon:yes gene_type:complete
MKKIKITIKNSLKQLKMSKLKTVVAVAAIGALMTSCQVKTLQLTNNPIGTKTGKAIAKPFQKDANFTYKQAAENGKIQKIGSATFTSTSYIIFGTLKTEVTGE